MGLVLIFLLFVLCYYPCMKYDYIFKFDVTYQDYLNWYDEHGEDSEERDDNDNHMDHIYNMNVSKVVDNSYVPLKDKPVDRYNM